MLGRVVVPLLYIADRRYLAGSDDHPLIVINKRRALRVDEHQTALGFQSVEKRIQQSFLVGISLYPWPVGKPIRLVGLIFRPRVYPVPFDNRLAVDLAFRPLLTPRPFLQQPAEGCGGGGIGGVHKGSVADVFVMFACFRISVPRKPPLRLRREKIHAFGKAGWRVFVRHCGQRLAFILLFKGFILGCTNAI